TIIRVYLDDKIPFEEFIRKTFGGFCLPKDLDSLIKFGRDYKTNIDLLNAIKNINEVMPE
ncbi:unnamed protein product, partial [marine sediment metagenome]